MKDMTASSPLKKIHQETFLLSSGQTLKLPAKTIHSINIH